MCMCLCLFVPMYTSATTGQTVCLIHRYRITQNFKFIDCLAMLGVVGLHTFFTRNESTKFWVVVVDEGQGGILP